MLTEIHGAASGSLFLLSGKMSAIKAKTWVVKKSFEGFPKRDDLEIVEEELPPLKDGEFLVEASWLTVDPYMRLMTPPPGNVMIGAQVGKVLESKHKDYAVGDTVQGMFGWRTHTISDGDPEKHWVGLYKVDTSRDIRLSTALGILGMTGATAYFGVLDVLKPKAGETLVVNAAAGAVGTAVGQIGKIKGLRVVGFAGSDEKVAYLKSLGFDAAYNYKTVSSLTDALKEGCPNGVDVFFDNVGGDFFDAVLAQMNTDGRVACCGSISQYNLTDEPKARPITGLVVMKQLVIRGFVVPRWLPQWPEAFKQLYEWIQEDKLKYKEVVYEGFESMFDAFESLFKGKHIGKVVVKV